MEKTLYGIHRMLGSFAPRFAMERDQAREIADALHEVNKHYNYKLLGDKEQAWVNLAMVAGGFYVSALMATRSDAVAARMARPPMPRAQSQNPVPGNPAPMQTPERAAPSFDAPTAKQLRTGIVDGIGAIEFPPDHPLARGMGLN